MLSKATLNEIRVIHKLAQDYANLLMDHGGSIYSGPVINPDSKTIYFSVGPTTHGLSRMVTLPLSILDTPERLGEFADAQRKKWREEDERRICKTCGQYKFSTQFEI